MGKHSWFIRFDLFIGCSVKFNDLLTHPAKHPLLRIVRYSK